MICEQLAANVSCFKITLKVLIVLSLFTLSIFKKCNQVDFKEANFLSFK